MSVGGLPHNNKMKSQMKKHDREWLAIVLLFMAMLFTLGACTSINDTLKNGYGATELSKRINIDLLEKDVITAETGQKIQDKTKIAEAGLDTAFKIKDINKAEAKSTAEKALESAQEVLDTLTNYAKGAVK